VRCVAVVAVLCVVLTVGRLCVLMVVGGCDGSLMMRNNFYQLSARVVDGDEGGKETQCSVRRFACAAH